MTRAPQPPRRLREIVRAVGAVAVVTAGAAALLAFADGVPAWISGEARGVRRARTIAEAERALRARLVVPYYYPSSLAWPPERIRFRVGAHAAAALWVSSRDGSPHLLIAQTLGPGRIPESLAPEVAVLGRSPVAVGPIQGTLARVLDDGAPAWELAWEQRGRSLLLRTRGSVDELLRMARSTREAP